MLISHEHECVTETENSEWMFRSILLYYLTLHHYKCTKQFYCANSDLMLWLGPHPTFPKSSRFFSAVYDFSFSFFFSFFETRSHRVAKACKSWSPAPASQLLWLPACNSRPCFANRLVIITLVFPSSYNTRGVWPTSDGNTGSKIWIQV